MTQMMMMTMTMMAQGYAATLGSVWRVLMCNQSRDVPATVPEAMALRLSSGGPPSHASDANLGHATNTTNTETDGKITADFLP